MFIGMGASYCSSFGGSVFLQTHGHPSFTVDAGEWLNYASSVWDDASVSILLTTSGESAELVEFFRQAGDRALGLICNNPASACWQLAQNKLPILAGPEYGNATKTYTNATAASIILASEIAGLPWKQDADQAAEVFAAHLDPSSQGAVNWSYSAEALPILKFVGRGAGYGGAFMGALCIREMSGNRAAPHTGAGFKHGPNLDIDGSHVAIILALGRAAHLGVKLAQECKPSRRQSRACVERRACRHRKILFPVKDRCGCGTVEGITSQLVTQALTLAMVERTGCRLPPRFQYGVMEQ